jgi:hypothetical protein
MISCYGNDQARDKLISDHKTEGKILKQMQTAI